MARGPLPDPNAQRRNAPTIAGTQLPAKGRAGRAPAVPKSYDLGKAGKAWWTWAWKTPQATAWDAGALYVVARRAQLEDDLAALGSEIESVKTTLSDFLGLTPDSDNSRLDEIVDIFAGLKRSSGNQTTVMREMRELDERLGLTPKSLAALRWTIVDDVDTAAQAPAKQSKAKTNRRARLSVVA